jgi:hypothetical protein
MKSWKQVLPFLILNIIVSAATTLAVLMLWDRTQTRASLAGVGGIPAQTGAAGNDLNVSQPTIEATLPPLDQPVIVVETVIGAGDLNNEAVILKRVGEGELPLTGWKLTNGRGGEYVFPYLVLNTNGSVRVYSKAGVDSVIELFWNQSEAMWKTGDALTLYDSDGNSRATYTVP